MGSAGFDGFRLPGELVPIHVCQKVTDVCIPLVVFPTAGSQSVDDVPIAFALGPLRLYSARPRLVWGLYMGSFPFILV